VVIAIDGPGGAGKSTVARAVAGLLGFEHLDTGATYRAATLAALEGGVDPDDAGAVLQAVSAADIEYLDGIIHLNGRPVAAAVRGEDVNAAVSAVSAHPEVRKVIVAVQRDWVADRGGSAVVEGRDIGTVVFPEAAVKVFITARSEIRAARRAGDAEAADKAVSEIEADLARRDHIDSTRDASPLRPAEDAAVIDTSEMGVAEVTRLVMDLVYEKRPGLRPGR
jgi:cytidylate kinase